MDDEDILQLVADGEIDASEIADFKELSDEMQQMVADGELSVDEARELE